MMAPPRGRVLDRFGIVLAGNSINWRAELVAEESTNVSATLDNFTAIIPISDYERARIDREVHRHRKFIPILIKEFLTWEEMAKIEVNAPDLPGVVVDNGTKRVYIRSPTGSPTSSAMSLRPMTTTSPTTRCSRCPACASGGPAWRNSMTWRCAAERDRSSWR